MFEKLIADRRKKSMMHQLRQPRGGFRGVSEVSRNPLEISQCRAVKIKIL